MEAFITVLIIIACVLLAMIILIQNPKGGGLDSTLGRAIQMGVLQKTTNVFNKATIASIKPQAAISNTLVALCTPPNFL